MCIKSQTTFNTDDISKLREDEENRQLKEDEVKTKNVQTKKRKTKRTR